MAYTIKISREAALDLAWLTAAEQSFIKRALPVYLKDQPTLRSNHRKPMEANPLGAPWALRLGDLRVYYETDEEAKVVNVLNAGRKPGNTVSIRGVAYDLREGT